MVIDESHSIERKKNEKRNRKLCRKSKLAMDASQGAKSRPGDISKCFHQSWITSVASCITVFSKPILVSLSVV